MSRSLKLTLVVGLLLLAIVLPIAAQTATPDPSTLVVVAGPVDLQSGSIRVNGYRIAPASAFQPSILRQGDEVIIIGNLLPNEQVIQAVSFEFFEATAEPTPEVTMEPTAEVTLEPTVEVTPEATVAVTLEPTVQVTPDTGACNNPNQPVATNLAQSFGVSYAEIMDWHCAGFGFGEIARAYLLADASGLTPQTYFTQKSAGMGWGEIVREAGVHPSDLAPGQVIRQHGGDPASTAEAGSTHGNGNGQGNGNNGQGNGNGNGNNGQGNSHGNGNGNGQGNGNNGNGNGNGNANH